VITSNKNQILKETKSLKLKKSRDDRNQFFIEGTRIFEEALASNCRVSSVFFSETFSESDYAKGLQKEPRLKNVPIHIVADKIFDEISDTENPQGILCVIDKIIWNDKEILQGSEFFILLESIQDPGNMGTIIRTADAAGADAIILSKKCVDIYNPKVLRATMGSVFHIPILLDVDTTQTINVLKDAGVKVFASHLEAKKEYFEVNLTGKIAVIIGNEANGISEEVAVLADELIKIPMPGDAESLNASVAAAIIAFERVRQTHSQ
jgi:TrmH family RNA methyltransferase